MYLHKSPLFDGQQSVTTDRNRVLLALFPEEREVEVPADPSEDGTPSDPTTEKQTFAWLVWVEKPLTRAAAINAAEQSAYGLKTAMEVASFNASLARKARTEEDASEVSEHDEFINEVKAELTRIGVK